MLTPILVLIFVTLSSSKDVNTFSNYEIIKQTRIEANFNIDFTNKVIHGKVKSYFTALKDGEVIVLDSRALSIKSIIDSDTGANSTRMVYHLKYTKNSRRGII